MKELINLSGRKFGDWIVLYESPKRGNARMWHCRCICGKEKDVYQGNLIHGRSLGCRCSASNRLAERKMTHGLTDSRLYGVWQNMKRRCYDSSSVSYQNYGGRGIGICKDWLGENGFSKFYEWSVNNGYCAEAPRGDCTIDRIDVNGNYCPENCRWVSLQEQSRNKRSTKWIEYEGETISLAEFCEKYGVSVSLASERLARGWSPAEVLFFHPKNVNGAIEYNGEVKTARAWAKQYGIPKSSFQYRITHGWTFEQAAGLVPPPPKYR